jgi:hypothetical protein
MVSINIHFVSLKALDPVKLHGFDIIFLSKPRTTNRFMHFKLQNPERPALIPCLMSATWEIV